MHTFLSFVAAAADGEDKKIVCQLWAHVLNRKGERGRIKIYSTRETFMVLPVDYYIRNGKHIAMRYYIISNDVKINNSSFVVMHFFFNFTEFCCFYVCNNIYLQQQRQNVWKGEVA